MIGLKIICFDDNRPEVFYAYANVTNFFLLYKFVINN